MKWTALWKEQHPTVHRILVARALRSISQGIAVVDLTLYLKDLSWTGTQIGAVLTTAGIVGALFILAVGIVSDRTGRKMFLFYYELLTAIAALLAVITTNSLILSLIIIIAGFGRGQNGAAGPFTPVEQAWLAAYVPQTKRGSVFSLNNAIGCFGMAIGSVLAGGTVLWNHALPGDLAYRPLFALMFVMSLFCAWVILSAPPEHSSETVIATETQAILGHSASSAKLDPVNPDPTNIATPTAEDPSTPSRWKTPVETDPKLRRQENWNLFKLSIVNGLSGLALGLISPMMAYWFALKFDATTAEIGFTIALSAVFTGFSSLGIGWLSDRVGMVRSVVWLRIFSTVLIALLPIVPFYWLASAIYILRSALSRGTQGARAALSTSLTRDSRRGFSASINSLSVRATSSVGPTISGYLMSLNQLALPFYITAAVQFVSVCMYHRFFRSFDYADGQPAAKSNAKPA
ncbi:MAG: major facilitator superfamily 1 [Paenibacillaceae bacterium]|nr:major facilitator superfamily 1 [Paenibacillaceae bacterium]